MLSIEPAGLGEHDVELGAVGVLSVVGHGHPSGGAVRQDEVLIIETLAIDAAACREDRIWLYAWKKCLVFVV